MGHPCGEPRHFSDLVVNAIKEVITSVWNAIKSTVTGIVGGIKDAVVNVFNSLLSGIKNAMSGIAGAVRSGFDAAINFIKGLPSQALQWGKDIIGGLIDGIKSKISGDESIPQKEESGCATVRSGYGSAVPFGRGGGGREG